MSIPTLKATLAQVLASVPGMGTIDTARIDPDNVPRKLRGTTPYWGLSLAGLEDTPAGFGSGIATRREFREYTLRLEGWRGMVATADATTDWDTLVEGVVDELQTRIREIAQRESGFTGYTGGPRARIDVVELIPKGASEGPRAHHVVIEATFQFYYTPQ